MPMMTLQILKSMNFTKTQKSRYLENKAIFFLQIKTFINHTSRAALWQKKDLVEIIKGFSGFNYELT